MQTLAGVLSDMLDALSGDTDLSLTSTSTSSTAPTAQDQRLKCTAVAGLLWEQQAYSTLLQCYNAAFYFVTASTVPRPMHATTDTTQMNSGATAPGGSDSGSVMSEKDNAVVNAIAITLAGTVYVVYSVYISLLCAATT